ncbi:hypothetical protein [Halocalculus aciditolerans]|uniref:Uncharacterized protein n=1 Tax=Halocalculus aciditolerans TaxID=1383812 RepID=A0A830F548_9EURY|nr:hypothetical protein [Halocalculus aciditolerans]GGL63966.1 hypothetical protein GCM10009039_22290 [Halocalculus aciditolerans]
MGHAVVLTCPRCGAERAVEADGTASAKAGLLQVATDHLDDHAIRETKAALTKHAMVGRADEREVDDARFGEWLPGDAAADTPQTA